jgi:hypothetical protein
MTTHAIKTTQNVLASKTSLPSGGLHSRSGFTSIVHYKFHGWCLARLRTLFDAFHPIGILVKFHSGYALAVST